MRGLLLCALAGLLQCGSGPSSEPAGDAAGPPVLFREAARETGLVFDHFVEVTGEYRLPEIVGSGVGLLDFDLDGDLDVYFLQGAVFAKGADPAESQFPPRGRLGNRLFENRLVPTGSLSFEDATDRSGLAFGGNAMGVAVGDYDADGDPDLYVTALGPNALFRNRGDGTFARVEGPQDERWTTSASFVDYDADGDLDLFFTNYVDFSVRNNKRCFSPVGARDYCNPTVYNPVPDRLFRNDGGRFTDVSGDAGLGAAFGNGLGVATADLDNDGLTDLFVANDSDENQFWRNRSGGRFEDDAMLSGAAVNADGRAEAGMGVIAADFDNDGDEDLFLTHNTLETNTLYLNNGRGLFRDATIRYGLGSSSMPFTGFGVAWADFDNDSRLDVFIANGAVAIMESQRGQPYPFQQHDLFYRGAESGFELAEPQGVWGDLPPLVGRGVATGDIDGDGDPDLVIANNNGPARLLLNQTGGSDWLGIALEAPGGNPKGIGSRVGLRFADGTSAWRRMHRDGSYLSASEPVARFGLAGWPAIESVEVRWPSGGAERFPAPEAAPLVILRKGSGSPLTP